MDQQVALDAARHQEAEKAGPLFHQQWWLDAAGAGRCETVTVEWDGTQVGSLTFLRTRRLGMTRLRMPPYTRTLGPNLSPPPSKAGQRGANIRRIITTLKEKLPAHDRFETTLDPDDDPAVAFAFDVAGFDVCQAFTFRVGVADDIDSVWDGLDKKTRNMVRSARRRNEVVAISDFDRFERLSRQERSEDGSTHDYPVLRKLYEEAARRGQGALHMAVQEDGQDAAALILVWDATTMYYWTSARNRALVSGANTLLLWDAIRFAKALGLTLDFDSYCSPTSARFLAGFGRPPVVRPVIGATTSRYRLAELAQGILRRAHPEVSAT